MSKGIFLFTMLFLVSVFPIVSSAQTPELLDLSNTWQHRGQFGWGNNYTIRTQNISFSGEIITVNGIEYQELRSCNIDSIYSQISSEPPIVELEVTNSDYQVGLLRQVGSGIYYAAGEMEFLYTDFDLEVGDYPQLLTPYNFPIGFIETIPFGLGSLQAFYIEGASSPLLLEGIGGFNGIMEGPGILIEGGSYLTQFGNATDTIQIGYGLTGFPATELECNIPQTVGFSEIPLDDVYIVNGLETDFIYLRQNKLRQLFVSIYNLNGQEIYNGGTVYTELTIDKSTMPAGLYVVTVRSNYSTVTKKIIVQ